ncbi:MAG: GNAT family N-acetyltransferase [Clostridia bacterium]|nr:GNAT family N-acetyltransferase [Clostridia bacterium]
MQVHIKRFDELTAGELYAILRLRAAVFVVEQNINYQDLDDRDQAAVHVWLSENDDILAYLRVMDKGVESEDVSIGRVLCVRRGCGLGSQVVKEGIRAAKTLFHAERIYLEAQLYVKGLYEKLGFRVISEPFINEGIEHVKMLLDGSSSRRTAV